MKWNEKQRERGFRNLEIRTKWNQFRIQKIFIYFFHLLFFLRIVHPDSLDSNPNSNSRNPKKLYWKKYKILSFFQEKIIDVFKEFELKMNKMNKMNEVEWSGEWKRWKRWERWLNWGFFVPLLEKSTFPEISLFLNCWLFFPSFIIIITSSFNFIILLYNSTHSSHWLIDYSFYFSFKKLNW